jgi:hypothetical protein
MPRRSAGKARRQFLAIFKEDILYARALLAFAILIALSDFVQLQQTRMVRPTGPLPAVNAP